MLKRVRFLLPAVALLVLITAACGDSGTSTTGAGGTTVETASDVDIDIKAVDFAFEPDTWSVAAGTNISVRFSNGGTLEHNWDILRTPIESEDELTEDLIVWEIAAAAGETNETAIDLLLPPGTYQVICSIPGHFSAGMVGELTITE